MNKRVGVSNVYFAISSVLGALLGCALGIILCFLWGDNSVEIPSLCSFVIAVASFCFQFSLFALIIVLLNRNGMKKPFLICLNKSVK